jgi:hypothetical protein
MTLCVKNSKRGFLGILLVFLVAFAIVPSVAGAGTITLVAPADSAVPMNSGNPITFQITGIGAGDTFSYQIKSTDLTLSSGNAVKLANVYMPYSLAGTSTINLGSTGVTGGQVVLKNLTDATEITKGLSVPYAGTYGFKRGNYDITFSGVPTAGVAQGIDYKVDGTLTANSDATGTLSFMVMNVDSGTLTVTINAGGTTVTKVITIAKPYSPGPAPTPISGNDVAPGPAAPANPVALLAPPGISATSATIKNPDGVVENDYVIETDPAAGFQASVEINKGTPAKKDGSPVTEISVTPLDPTSVPSTAQSGVFTFAGEAIECEPTGTSFAPGTATVTFSMTNAEYQAAVAAGKSMTVQTYNPETKAWEDIGGTMTYDAKTGTWSCSVEVSHFSMYALFYKAAATTPTPTQQTFGQLTPSAAVPTTAPGVPVAATTPAAKMAPTATQKSPTLPGLAIIGVIGAVGFLVMRKKE